MERPYLLPRESRAIPIAALRAHFPAPTLRIGDPAVRAMTDYRRDPLLIVTEEQAIEQVLDEMFRLGVRAFPVVREHVMTGLITIEHARTVPGRTLRVLDVMTPASDVPAIDWQVIEEAHVRDLMEIFDGSGARHLVVLESQSPTLSSVRGLIHRERLERQLGTRWPGASV